MKNRRLYSLVFPTFSIVALWICTFILALFGFGLLLGISKVIGLEYYKILKAFYLQHAFWTANGTVLIVSLGYWLNSYFKIRDLAVQILGPITMGFLATGVIVTLLWFLKITVEIVLFAVIWFMLTTVSYFHVYGKAK